MAGVQTAYTDKAPAARAGLLADNGILSDIEKGHANGVPRVGNLTLLSGPTNGALEAAEVAPLAALTSSATAILASTASSASVATITSGSTPALQDARINPARRITAIFSSQANWDLTTIYISGEDVMGNPIREALVLPDTGGVTLTTKQFFSRVTEVYLPAQSGTAGTFTMGYTADEGIYHPETVGVLIRDTAREPLDANDALADNDNADVVKRGKIWVKVESAVTAKGIPAYLRTATSGNNVMGQWSGAAAAGFTLQPWAFFQCLSDSDGFAVLHKKV